MSKCPKCNDVLINQSKCDCGWRKEIKQSHNFKFSRQVGTRVVDAQCSFNDFGIRCVNEGYISHGTTGEGPWYCRSCWAKLTKSEAVIPIDRKESMEDVDKRVNKLVPRREGESSYDWTMRCRQWTINKLSEMRNKREVLVQEEPGALG